jgi:hypothetical protein
MMKPLSLGYQKIDICSNFSMLYYLENAKLPRATATGGAWVHAPPQEENGRWTIRLSFFSPSLPYWL